MGSALRTPQEMGNEHMQAAMEAVPWLISHCALSATRPPPYGSRASPLKVCSSAILKGVNCMLRSRCALQAVTRVECVGGLVASTVAAA